MYTVTKADFLPNELLTKSVNSGTDKEMKFPETEHNRREDFLILSLFVTKQKSVKEKIGKKCLFFGDIVI